MLPPSPHTPSTATSPFSAPPPFPWQKREKIFQTLEVSLLLLLSVPQADSSGSCLPAIQAIVKTSRGKSIFWGENFHSTQFFFFSFLFLLLSFFLFSCLSFFVCVCLPLFLFFFVCWLVLQAFKFITNSSMAVATNRGIYISKKKIKGYGCVCVCVCVLSLIHI